MVSPKISYGLFIARPPPWFHTPSVDRDSISIYGTSTDKVQMYVDCSLVKTTCSVYKLKYIIDVFYQAYYFINV